MLNASIRSSELTGPIAVVLIADRSMLNCPGPRTLLRPVLPNVPVVSATCWKQDVLNHLSIVAPLLSAGSQVVFGRLFVMPVDSMLCDCVIVIGRPDRRYRLPLIWQPPHALLAPHGSASLQFESNVCGTS